MTGEATARTMRVRCDQNRLFGCRRVNVLPVTESIIGVSRRRFMAVGSCVCGLPLARVGDDGPVPVLRSGPGWTS